jgi:hypothetical protein
VDASVHILFAREKMNFLKKNFSGKAKVKTFFIDQNNSILQSFPENFMKIG